MATSVPLVDRDLAPATPAARRLSRELEAVLGEGGVSTGALDRAAAGRDLWPKSLLWLREGRVPRPPDLVAWPRTLEQVVEVVRFAAAKGVPLIPYGAGSGVCGGTLALHGGIALDLKRLDRVRRIDPEARLLEAEAGVLGLPLEERLQARGLTLGHFPSSIMVSTVGGWVAARGAGQSSARYGKIEDMVQGLTVVLGTGEVARPSRPAAGPDLVDLFTGSEGTLGVITDATFRLWPKPEVTIPRGFRFATLGAALEAIRAVFRAGLRPSVLRLYDPFDTRIAMRGHEEPSAEAAAAPLAPEPSRRARAQGPLARTIAARLSSVKRAAVSRALAVPRGLNLAAGGFRECLLVVVHEGAAGLTELEADRLRGILAAGGGRDLGEGPGRHWLARRYAVSYKMPPLFDAGGWVDTFEVATSWGRVESLYHAVREAVSPFAFVMAHFSHAYADGCSIYFTFVGSAVEPRIALDGYDAAWAAALEAASRAGATLTHHHGVGVLKASHLAEELSPGGVALLRAAKAACDPHGILNPGKLLP